MRKRNLIVAALAIVFVVSTAGCASRAVTAKIKVNSDAFGSKKKFAVVTIAGTKKFYGERGLSQMFKRNDDILGANTQPIIDKLRPKVIRTLARAKNFRLVPEGRVLKNRTYKTIEADPKVQKVLFFKAEMNTARPYKYIIDEEKMRQLANALKVDGVIALVMNFSIQSDKTGATIAGLSFGKKDYKAVVATTAIGYDRSGEMIWKDSTIKETQPGDTKAIIGLDVSDITKTNFAKLQPKAVEMGEKTVRVLLTRLDSALAGEKVSRIQKVRDKSLYEDK